MTTYRFTKKLIESISTETNLDLLKDMANYCSMKSIEALCDLGNSKQESLYDSRLALISRRYIEVIGYKVGQQLLITTDTTSHKLRTIKSIGYDTMSLVLDRCYLNILDFGGDTITLYHSGQSRIDHVCIQSIEIVPETPIEEVEIVETKAETNTPIPVLFKGDKITVTVDTDTLIKCVVIYIDQNFILCKNNLNTIQIIWDPLEIISAGGSYKIDKIEKFVPITRRVVISNKTAKYNNID